MKGTGRFKETIQAELEKMAEKDPLFAESLKKENKNIEGCINYIYGRVRKLGEGGYTDDEIFGMAAHYYDEDDLKEADAPTGGMKVIINHKPDLKAEEIAELKEQARREVIEAEKQRLTSRKKKPAPDKEKEEQQLSLL